jgi:hypothetical protein
MKIPFHPTRGARRGEFDGLITAPAIPRSVVAGALMQ